jgi:hypothetical protein
MSGNIFLLTEGANLVKMQEAPYATEQLLQEFLARYPDLLPGDQIDPDQPRRWLLVAKEMAVPGEVDGSGRWSLDHLFLDQDGIPTLVEVKRSTDSRIRREVVGQMLDYAANAVAYWPVETIRSRFERTCELRNLHPTSELAAFLGDGREVDSFWQAVKTNLQAGRVRLIFVADEIPQELRRVVEFLNGQMDPAEVLAVEIKQFTDQGKLSTLVPRLVGNTAIAGERKGGSSPKHAEIDEDTFLSAIRQGRGEQELKVVKRIIDWAVAENMKPGFNKWEQSMSFIPTLETHWGLRYPLSVQSRGGVWLQMRWLRQSAPFDDEAKREELRQKLNGIPGVEIPTERMTGYPQIPLPTLVDPAALQKLIETLTWLVNELRSPSKNAPGHQVDDLQLGS